MSPAIFPRALDRDAAEVARRRRILFLSTGIAGIAAVVLANGAQGFVQVGGSEPPFDASAAVIHDFFDARVPTLYAVGSYLGVLAAVVLLWFVAGMHALLRDAEGDPPWRSTAALLAGLVYVAGILGGGWDLAVFRMEEGVDPQLARFAYDMGNLGFASSWVALGSFALAAGWVILSSRSMPRLMGWWAVAGGAVLVTARAVWTSQIWLIGYALVMLWIVVVSVFLLRERTRT